MAPETKTQETEEPIAPQDFLPALFGEICTLAEELGMAKVFEVSGITFEKWQTLYPRSRQEMPTTTPLKLTKGLIFSKPALVLALTLGDGIKNSYDRSTPVRLQFGGDRDDIDFTQRSEAENLLKLKSLVAHHSTGSSYIYGEFYFSRDRNTIEVACHYDDPTTHKGLGIDHWPQAKLLTTTGIEKCVDIVKRTIQKEK